MLTQKEANEREKKLNQERRRGYGEENENKKARQRSTHKTKLLRRHEKERAARRRKIVRELGEKSWQVIVVNHLLFRGV